MSGDMSTSTYGLDDPNVLRVAIELDPELFAALEICERFAGESYPISSDREIEEALAAVANVDGNFESAGVKITQQIARDRFPDEFLPVRNRLDFLRKVYMALVISHEGDARERILAAKRGEVEVNSSHPLDLELL